MLLPKKKHGYNCRPGDHMSKKQVERNSDSFKGLPPRIVKSLRHSGINSLEEAQKLSDAELAGVKNIGAETARIIREWKP
jgi:ERCC4-type nuclease